MKIKVLLTVFILFIILHAYPGQIFAATPSNQNANSDARKILNYLEYLGNLPNNTQNKVILGQYMEWGNTGYQRAVVGLYNQTGKWPALIGSFYGEGQTDSQIAVVNQIMINYWNQGGLIDMDFFANNPWTNGSPNDMSSVNLTDLITPGTAINTVWMAELDKIAGYLQTLQNAGVVVIWRPFHEMNGDWFWWSVGTTSKNYQPYINMWRHMYNYFTNVKGLNNLLWLYAVNQFEDTGPMLGYYPGAGYVDLVGVDTYKDGTVITGDQNTYNTLLNFGKPFVFAEVGPALDGTKIQDGTFDTMNIINSIKNSYPKTAYFMEWDSWSNMHVALVDCLNASTLVNDPMVMTREELNWKGTVLPTPSPSPVELIINDNEGYGFTTYASDPIGDPWVLYADTSGKSYFGFHHYNNMPGNGSDVAIWNFTVPSSGIYDVYAWWRADSYRPTDVPFTINYTGGSSTVRVNQTQNGSRWNLLGTFNFQNTGSIVVSDNVTNGRDIVADAIRLVYKNSCIPADVNCSGYVNWEDLKTVISKFKSTDAASDVNRDGKVNLLDAGAVILNFGK